MDTRISGYKFDEKQGPHKLLTNYKTEKKKVPSQLKNIMDTTNNETN